jgi:hypothetical protein
VSSPRQEDGRTEVMEMEKDQMGQLALSVIYLLVTLLSPLCFIQLKTWFENQGQDCSYFPVQRTAATAIISSSLVLLGIFTPFSNTAGKELNLSITKRHNSLRIKV